MVLKPGKGSQSVILKVKWFGGSKNYFLCTFLPNGNSLILLQVRDVYFSVRVSYFTAFSGKNLIFRSDAELTMRFCRRHHLATWCLKMHQYLPSSINPFHQMQHKNLFHLIFWTFRFLILSQASYVSRTFSALLSAMLEVVELNVSQYV